MHLRSFASFVGKTTDAPPTLWWIAVFLGVSAMTVAGFAPEDADGLLGFLRNTGISIFGTQVCGVSDCCSQANTMYLYAVPYLFAGLLEAQPADYSGISHS